MNTNKSPKLTKISGFKLGIKVQGFYLCLEKNYKISKTGMPYLDIILSDNTGKINAKIWDNADHFSEKFSIGNSVAVKGIPVEFMAQLQLNVLQINLAEVSKYEKYGFNPDDLVQKITENPGKLFSQIMANINKMKSIELKQLCYNVYTEFKTEITNSPASLNNHYPLKGGLILHLNNCLNLGLQCVKNYKFLNKDLLIAGILLHDIGKIKCFSGDFIFSETDDSKLIGHEVLGLNILNKEIDSISNFPIELKQKLVHILIAHHKTSKDEKREWQRIPEALAIFNINRLDAQVDIMNRVFINANDIQNGWTNGKHHFKTSLFIE